MRAIYPLLLILSITLLCCCSDGKSSVATEPTERVKLHYAKGLEIERYDDFVAVEVKNPWDTTRILQRYILVDRELEKLPTHLPHGTVVRVPIEKLVVYTSVHTSIVEMLQQLDRICGACEVRYISSPQLQERIAKGTIADIGESTSPNIERIIDIGSEAILSSPFKDAGYGPAEKLGIPIIEGADYMENHPLGRVEWLKFYGLLLGAEELADSVFTATCHEYNALKGLTDTLTHRPTLLTESLYGGQWAVAGGKSYAATLYRDAGAEYLFDHLNTTGSQQLSFEAVLDRAIHADIWLMRYFGGRDKSYSDLKGEHAPYANFDAFKQRHIYACNSSRVPFYEETPMHPQWLLAEYIHLFHPHLLPHHTLRYYMPMVDESTEEK